VSEALAQMGGEEGDPFGEMQDALPGSEWQTQPLEEEGWKGVRLEGRVARGVSLFPAAEGEQPQAHVSMRQRLLSTDYTVEGELQMPSGEKVDEDETARTPQGHIVLTQQTPEEETPFDDEALAGLLGAMGQQPSVGFKIRCPGTIVSTNGTIVDDGAAEWRFDMGEMMGQPEELPALGIHVHSRLLNHQNIGRLADKLAEERDLPDMSALIAEYVTRGLLPNPPKADPLKAGLDAEAYDNAIGIIVIFEDAVGGPMAGRIVRGLRLNADNITAKRLREMYELVSELEGDELVEVGAQAVLKHVKMLSD